MTWFTVLDRRASRWVIRQKKQVNVSPGASTSGLREAWVGDLNRDGRVEIAIRDAITPAAGEVLSVFRQVPKRPNFFRLQGIGGDRVKVVRRRGRAAVITVLRTSRHSPDGREHLERWKWSKRTGLWRCTSDCVSF